MRNLLTGLVIAVVIPILLVTIGLAHFCNRRICRRRKEKNVIARQDRNDTGGGEENSHLYFQLKAELDDEQRKHEMEAIEVIHELDGENEIREMPSEEIEKTCVIDRS